MYGLFPCCLAVLPSFKLQIFRLDRYTGSAALTAMVAEILTVVYVIYYMVREIKVMKKMKKEYFKVHDPHWLFQSYTDKALV